METTAADLVDALEQDPTFAANLLRYCRNSAAAAHPVRAKTVGQAVMLVGRRSLRRLAMEAATFRFLERARGNGRASVRADAPARDHGRDRCCRHRGRGQAAK